MSEQVEPSPQGQGNSEESRLVPVAESIKYRRRAQQAEGQLQQFEQQLKDLQSQLEHRSEELGLAEAQRDEARMQLTVVGNQAAAERLLSEAGVVDLETASLLLSKRLDLSHDLEGEQLLRGVEQLLLDKPYLRRGANCPLPPATASARDGKPGGIAQLTSAADKAVATGDRRDVAEYLRLRRQTSPPRRSAGR
ncbi:MAG: hypothetical protein WC869_05120 [Phycisphaerae bacterium]|jgi:TolA-binding protein